MKDKKQKKNKGESVIGKIIYGFLLFLPLFAIGVTCLVNVFNNTEQQETTINYKYETNEVNSVDDLKVGNIYTLNQVPENISYNLYYLKGISKTGVNFEYKNSGIFTAVKTEYTGVIKININYQGVVSYFIDLNFNQPIDVIFATIPNTIDINNVTKCTDIPIESVETHEINRNNTFYNAIEQVENSGLFNWAKESIIYTGITATCNALSITNTFIPMLMTYWLIISVMYFLYDIILMCVLILHNKIHEIQDSI